MVDSLYASDYEQVIDISSPETILSEIGRLLSEEEWNSELFTLINNLAVLGKEMYP
jgi:hypothetical protein